MPARGSFPGVTNGQEPAWQRLAADDIRLRAATADDIARMTDFIFVHGPNAWNYLPQEGIREHLRQIAAGRIEAVVAEAVLSGATPLLVGFVSYQPRSQEFVRYQTGHRSGRPHAYVCEAVVHRDAAGRGIGARLLASVVERLFDRDVADIYIDRHADNAPSGGMMRKAGFSEVESYDDAMRRPAGSRRTTVCRLSREDR